MCGISGIIFNGKKTKNLSLSFYHLLEKIEKLELIIKSDQELENLYNLSWKYKNDASFLLYFCNPNERKCVKNINAKIEKFLKTLDYLKLDSNDSNIALKVEKIKDINWFLKNEIQQTYEFVSNFVNSDNNYKHNSTIIFYKNLSTIINSINFLEMRGRDSLGISVNLNVKIEKNKDQKKISNLVFKKKYSKYTSINLVFKTSNSIGYLGENSEIIINQIKKNKAFNKFISNSEIINGSIICHTRWASVGKVNNDNCHPISNFDKYSTKKPYIHAFVNGDIYNYSDIINEAKLNDSHLNSKCSSDTVSIPYLFTSKTTVLTDTFIKPRLNKIIGSYALALVSSCEPNKVLISKSGSQGLYMGFSEDNIMFSSDVYGLVQNCRYYYSMPSDYYLCINNNKNNPLILKSITSSKKIKVSDSDFVESLITTRDISKLNYPHFLKKEIYETESILRRTCLSHIDTKKFLNKSSNFFGEQFNNINDDIIKKISENSFDEIIITGMGTCYTAAVVISRYMRKILRLQNPNIIVQPHIASEGSAFYLKSKMENTLVIVIAQSGTTIDTNVYVKLAKNRGAKTISIVNKRDGDVTFLVDSSIYLGNGRDIEIAVPSTKTFNAHIITGYLLSLFFYRKTKNYNKKILNNDINSIIHSPNLALKSINSFNKLKVKNDLIENLLKKKHWYMLHDDSEVSASCQEVRIKLSECCYTSIPYHSLNYLNYHKIEDSALIIMIGKKNDSVTEKRLRVLSKTNLVYIISDKFLLNTKNIFTLKTPKTQPFFSFLPSVIFGQLLSYNIALRMDNRKQYIQELIDKRFNKESKLNLKTAYKNKLFVKGIEQNDQKTISQFILASNNNFYQKKAKEIINLIKRPIDTIKHQAKTITVGTQRIQQSEIVHKNEFGKTNYLNCKDEFYYKELFSYISVSNSQIKDKKNIFFYSDSTDETIIYFAINYLQNMCDKLYIKKDFHLARKYDLQSIKKNKNNLLVNLNYKRVGKNLKEEINILFSNETKKIQNIFKIKKESSNASTEIDEAIDIFKFSNNLLMSIIDKRIFEVVFNNITEMQNSLYKSLVSINNFKVSKKLSKLITELLSSRNNVKFIGSGINYNVSKIASKILSKKWNIACAHDVLENHKHIDMSAEPLIFVIISNINNSSYQMDAKAEIEKFISHGNIPILILNSGDNRFDNVKVIFKNRLRQLIKIKIENSYEDVSFIPSLVLINKLIKSL